MPKGCVVKFSKIYTLMFTCTLKDRHTKSLTVIKFGLCVHNESVS